MIICVEEQATAVYVEAVIYLSLFGCKIVYQSFLGSACRFKVISWLAKRYKTPKEAESLLHGSSTQLNSSSVNNDASCVEKSKKATCASTQTDDMEMTTIFYCYDKLSADFKLKILSKLFTSYMLSNFCLLVPDDFLSYTAEAMVKLKSSERTNVLYNLTKGIGTPRADNSSSRFPTDRIPMGLVEYTASFYASDDLEKVFCILMACHSFS